MCMTVCVCSGCIGDTILLLYNAHRYEYIKYTVLPVLAVFYFVFYLMFAYYAADLAAGMLISIVIKLCHKQVEQVPAHMSL